MKQNTLDVVIIDNSKNDYVKSVTKKSIETLLASETEILISIFIVEGNKDISFSDLSDRITMVYPESDFGYHKYLNIGRKLGTAEFVCLCNNDLWFKKDWATNIITQMRINSELLSASPFSVNPHKGSISLFPIVQYGSKIRAEIAGWCIFQQRKIYDIIGDLDEQFIFWYCDDDYALTLMYNKIKHALITNSVVNHLESSTLKTLDEKTMEEYTVLQKDKFYKKWNISL